MELIRSRRQWPEDLVTRRAAAGAEGKVVKKVVVAAAEERVWSRIGPGKEAPATSASPRTTRAYLTVCSSCSVSAGFWFLTSDLCCFGVAGTCYVAGLSIVWILKNVS